MLRCDELNYYKLGVRVHPKLEFEVANYVYKGKTSVGLSLKYSRVASTNSRYQFRIFFLPKGHNIDFDFRSTLILKFCSISVKVITYRKVASSNTSRLEAYAGFFRLLMKGIFDAYVQWPFTKKIISELITRVSTQDSMVFEEKGQNCSLLWMHHQKLKSRIDRAPYTMVRVFLLGL